MEAGFEDTYSLVEERHPWFVRRRELFAGMVAGGEHLRILDVGCGTGAFLEHLRELGFRRLTGVEPSAVLRQRFRLRDAPLHERIPDGEFDVVFMLDVLEHIDDDRAALEQVRERLCPGGRFFLSVPAHPFLWSRHDEVNLHRRRYKRAELSAEARGSGVPHHEALVLAHVRLPADRRAAGARARRQWRGPRARERLHPGHPGGVARGREPPDETLRPAVRRQLDRRGGEAAVDRPVRHAVSRVDAGAEEPRRGARVFLLAAFAVALASAHYALTGDVSLSYGDDGWLWYAVERTIDGEVPVRDFQSYDPGRFEWSAALSRVFGRGILAVRKEATAFQALALFAGLLVAWRLARPRWLIVPLGMALTLWMFPRNKLYDSSIAIMAVFALSRLVERPSLRRHFAAGIFVGLTTFFGKNHALYTTLAALCIVALMALKDRDGAWPRRAGAWAGGALVGSLPLVGYLLFVPGFAAGYLETIRLIVEHGSNVELPYPLPWSLGHEGLAWYERVGVACAFLLPLVAVPVGLVAALVLPAARLRAHPVVVAGAFLGLFYFHHVSVRSDGMHLAQCIHPSLFVLFGLLAWPRERTWLAAAGVPLALVVTVLAALSFDPPMRGLRPGAALRLVDFDAGGDTLRLVPGQAAYLEGLERTIAATVPRDEALLIAPVFCTLYCLLDRHAPVWTLNFWWPESEETQRRTIRELEAADVQWVLVVNASVDNRGDLLFHVTNPLVMAWIRARFELASVRLPRGHFLWRARR